MKPSTHCIKSGLKVGALGIASCMIPNPAMAIEPPADHAHPPAALQQNADAKFRHPDAKAPFIGVVTAALPEMVADHVQLERGTGLIVRTVLPDSPAETSGLKTNDIILHVDDAPVNDPEVFGEKIRNHKIGDAIKLKVIQRGKPSTLEVKLSERPAGDLSAAPKQEPLLDGIPHDQAKRLRDMIERNLNAFGPDAGEPLNPLLVPDQLMDQRFKMLRERMNDALKAAPEIQFDQQPGLQLQQHSTIRMMDNDGSIEFKSTGANSEVIVRDPDNKIIWSGPWDTPQDMAAAPDEIRARIEKLNIQKGKGIELRFGR
ncbi:MAG: hypothetical protein RL346_1724 [Verrucomicrobiota bacterium]|jgi:hypothetical protein